MYFQFRRTEINEKTKHPRLPRNEKKMLNSACKGEKKWSNEKYEHHGGNSPLAEEEVTTCPQGMVVASLSAVFRQDRRDDSVSRKYLQQA